jgi:glucose-6-phosphate 1-dehydrogenase
MNTHVVIFGGSGQLATQRLVPALAESEIFSEAQVIALGRTKLTNEQYYERLSKPETISDDTWEAFKRRVQYIQADHEAGYADLADRLPIGDRLLYLSIPPQATKDVIEALTVAHIHEPMDGISKLILEKPFGLDSHSATELQQVIEKHFSPDQVYPIDHYLAKETVSNILAFRFGNALFEPIWTSEFIREVQITVAETDGIEERLSTYAGLGATCDVLQNHTLQLLSLLCMEEPTDWSAEATSHSKTQFLKDVYARADLTVLAQYTMDEATREGLHGSETYAATVLYADTPRWRGVPFSIRTGKKLAAHVTDVTVHFRPCASALFGISGHANSLTFRIQPDESIFMSLAVQKPATDATLAVARMTFCYHDSFHHALTRPYVRVLEAVCAGDRSVAVAPSVIQEAWRIVAQMQLGDQQMHSYEPRTWGPEAADHLMDIHHSHWTVTEGDVCNGITMIKQ